MVIWRFFLNCQGKVTPNTICNKILWESLQCDNPWPIRLAKMFVNPCFLPNRQPPNVPLLRYYCYGLNYGLLLLCILLMQAQVALT